MGNSNSTPHSTSTLPPNGNGSSSGSFSVPSDLNKIQSEAYRAVEEIRGAADAKATEVYAQAYNQSPQAVAFYEFTRTIESYKTIVGENTTLVLSTDSDLFKFLKGMDPDRRSTRR
jgi:hypothetical protein